MNAVSIVVPMYRTAATAAELHQRLSDAVKHIGVAEFVYVDDACDQGSGDAIARLRAADQRVISVCHTTNRGQHQAIRSGLRRATGEAVVVLDGDLQDPPEAIPSLLAALRDSPFDAVFAGRKGEYEGSLRMATGRAFKRVLSCVARTPLDAGGYVVMSNDLVKDLLSRSTSRPYLLADVAATGRPITSIPIVRYRRTVGESATSSITRLRLAIDGLATAQRARRR